jgi:hypothetical protein
MPKEFVRLSVERLEQRDNPSRGWSFWEDTYIGAFLSGLGEGAVNIATGARDAVVEVVHTGGDLVTVWSNWNNIDPSQLNSRLFQGVIETANDSTAAASYDRQLLLGIVTLGVVPLVESGYDAIITGDSTQFSQQAGGFGVMTLVPSAGVKVLNKLPNVPIRLPMPTASGVLIGADGTLMAVPSGIAWAEVGVISFAVPAETATAITVAAMSVTGPGTPGTPPSPPSTPSPPPIRPGGRAPEFPAGQLTESGFLSAMEEYLGPGYTEASPGRFVSADGLRQVRYGAHETSGPRHHAHFEAYDRPAAQGGRVIENSVVDLIPD